MKRLVKRINFLLCCMRPLSSSLSKECWVIVACGLAVAETQREEYQGKSGGHPVSGDSGQSKEWCGHFKQRFHIKRENLHELESSET